jgi:PAS domain S-box-containing protein
MNLRTRLYLSIAVSVVLTLTISILILLELFQVQAMVQDNLRVNALTKQIVLLQSLTDDYLDHPQSRTEQQWQLTYSRFGQQLKDLQSGQSEFTRIPDSVITNYADIKLTFDQLVATFHRLNLSDLSTRVMTQELETSTSSLLLTKNQTLYDWVLTASTTSNKRLLASMEKTSITLMLLLVALATSVGMVLYLTSRKLVRSINNLHQGVETITRGDLNHRIPITSRDEFGKLSGAFNTMTEEVQALYDKLETKNRTLQESEERFRALVEQSTDCVVILKLDGNFTYISPSIRNLLGYAPDELRTQVAFGYVHPEDIPKTQAAFQQLLQASGIENTVSLSIRARHKNGQWRDMEIVGTNLLNQPAVAGLVINFWDVTIRKQAEESRRQAEAKYHSIFDHAVEGIYQTTPSGRIMTANQAFANMLGYESPDALISAVPDFTHRYLHPGNRQKLLQLAGQHGIVRDFECQLLRKDGNPVWVSISIRAMRDTTGQVLHYEGSMMNISKRKQLEEQFRQAQKMEAFGQLAGGVAHDFNNILTVIQANASFLQLENLSLAEQADSVREITQAAKRAGNLTRQLLTFSRRQPLEPIAIDLNETIENFSRMMRRLIGENITLASNFANDRAPILADPGMMEQILMNLAVNARDAMPKGGRLTIKTVALEAVPATFTHKLPPGPCIHLSVSDTGCGIAAKHLTRIFEPFFTTKDVGKGTGLGLATVFGIIEQHKGGITVESEVNIGTTFHLYLPRHTQSLALPKAHTAPEAKGGSETILLVEDDDSVRIMARKILANKGYRIFEANNGMRALEIWQSCPTIDLLLTDIIMPGGMTGRDLGKQLRAIKPTLKILFTSGYNQEFLDNASLEDDHTSFLAKPYEHARLVQVVRQCLDGEVVSDVKQSSPDLT